MYKEVKPIFFKCLSGLHAGSGADLGVVDLPIQRERHSGLPKIESSGVKGCIREEFDQIKDVLPGDFMDIAFGPDDGNKHSGSVAFTDARLLLFPVRSARGVFAYATSPYVLNRLKTDFALAKLEVPADTAVPAVPADTAVPAQVSGRALFIPNRDKVVLEEFTVTARQTDYAKDLAELIVRWLKLGGYQADMVKNNLIILSDDDFAGFAKNNTEIITRVKIDNKKGTVAKGHLFTEELLPAETVLYSLVMTSSIFLSKKQKDESYTCLECGEEKISEGEYLIKKIVGKMPEYMQLGGNATIGKGLVRVTVVGVE
ncbi:MAG: type III-B CRISPR module RAMP protein Cmr4 [Synergistaceae bacterium]|jgi:CRISPR-associated protein Cmr4|nr:type III-B CRISPR module RAMP protein Cmr4 [Synergistaceae bacterium]